MKSEVGMRKWEGQKVRVREVGSRNAEVGRPEHTAVPLVLFPLTFDFSPISLAISYQLSYVLSLLNNPPYQ